MALNMQIGPVPKMKIKVCMVGDSGVGKTSLVRRYVSDAFDDRYLTTIGTKITKKRILVRDTPLGTPIDVTLTLWDIMGQESFRELLKEAYFYGTNGLLAVTDVTDASTLLGIRKWIDLAKEVAGTVPVHLVANKIDIEDKVSTSQDDVQRTARELGSTFAYTSAKTGEQVEDSFHAIASAVVKARLDKTMPMGPRRV